MKIQILTLFPDMIQAYFDCSIIARACKKGLIELNIVNIRDFATNKYKTCDDEPYGGGHGMILKPEPLSAALDSVLSKESCCVFPTPVAPLFTQDDAWELSCKKELVFICGRYEGIDQRIIDLYVDKVYSLGDYVIASGEVASITILDASLRLMDGIIRKESLQDESFVQPLLEYPQYTRPELFRDRKVPEILLSGNHKQIEEWRNAQKQESTKKHRPDLLEK